MAGPLELEVRIARKHSEIVQSQYLIAQTYNRRYGIFFSNDIADLNAKIEPYPHRYIMGFVGTQLVAAAGLYTHNTYVERFGNISDKEIDTLIHVAGASGKYAAARKREFTKLSIREGWEGRGLGRFFFAASHSRDFLQFDTDQPQVLVCCAKMSIFKNMYKPVGIHTRRLKDFPRYSVHERYCSPDDPMESRLILPELDIPKRWFELKLPGKYNVDAGGSHGY